MNILHSCPSVCITTLKNDSVQTMSQITEMMIMESFDCNFLKSTYFSLLAVVL